MDADKIIKFILWHIDAGTIDDLFNETTFDATLNMYVLHSFGITVSEELLNDIIRDPDHYKRLISDYA
jgi:hypothetical protein